MVVHGHVVDAEKIATSRVDRGMVAREVLLVDRGGTGVGRLLNS